MTPALIRCVGKNPDQTIDISVRTDGSITSLGQLLANACQHIFWAHDPVVLPFIDEEDPEHHTRLGREEHLGSLVFGLIWAEYDALHTKVFHGVEDSRRYSHNQFKIGPASDKNLVPAYYVYIVEFRDYPKAHLGFDTPKRVWITIANDALKPEFEGWPEEALEMIKAKLIEDGDDQPGVEFCLE